SQIVPPALASGRTWVSLRMSFGVRRRSLARDGNALVERADREEGDDEGEKAETLDHGRRDDHHRLQRAGRFRLAGRAGQRRRRELGDAERAADEADAGADSDADVTESEIQHVSVLQLLNSIVQSRRSFATSPV